MKEKKIYEKPRLTVVSFEAERGFALSGELVGVFRLGSSWTDIDIDAWDGSSSGGGNHFGGGWIDNGGSAWE